MDGYHPRLFRLGDLVALTVLLGTTVFLSASLLFLIQPMAAKAMLPTFGGTSAVWVTSLVFFQTTLLVGYAYADRVNAWMSIGTAPGCTSACYWPRLCFCRCRF